LVVQRRRSAALALWILAGVVVAMSNSGAAALGYAVGSIMVALAWVSTPVAIWTGMIGAVAGLLFAPFAGSAASMLMEMLPANFAKGAHPLQRIEIWQQRAASIEDAPLFGIGFRGLGGEHPHNAALQIWLDFGVVGVVLAAGLVILTGIGLLRSRTICKPFALACATAIYANAYVSFGMWEGQWLATELLVAVFAIHALRELHHATPQSCT
jgi:O-antigen ligase